MEYQKENIGFFMWLLCRASCLPTISPQTPEVTARCADVRLKRSRKIGARPVSALIDFVIISLIGVIEIFECEINCSREM